MGFGAIKLMMAAKKNKRSMMLNIILLIGISILTMIWIRGEITKVSLNGKIFYEAGEIYCIYPRLLNRWLQIGHKTILPISIGNANHPSWSKDGGKFIYSVYKSKEQPPIYGTKEFKIWYELMEFDIKSQRAKILFKGDTNNFPDISIEFPSLSPDGEKICFFAKDKDEYLKDKWDLYLIKLTDSAPVKKLSSLGFLKYKTSWTPDSQNVLLSTEQNDIVLTDIVTGEIRKITKGSNPILSKDGTKIAFVENNNIYTYDLGKGSKKLIICDFNRTKGKSTNYEAKMEWSPDGKYLLYSRESNSLLWGLARTIVYDLIAVSVKHPFWKVRLVADSDYSDITWVN